MYNTSGVEMLITAALWPSWPCLLLPQLYTRPPTHEQTCIQCMYVYTKAKRYMLFIQLLGSMCILRTLYNIRVCTCTCVYNVYRCITHSPSELDCDVHHTPLVVLFPKITSPQSYTYMYIHQYTSTPMYTMYVCMFMHTCTCLQCAVR